MKKQFFSGVPEEVGEFLLHLLKFKNAAVNNNLSVILYPLSFLFKKQFGMTPSEYRKSTCNT